MRPSSKRRLAAGGTSLGVVAAIVVGVLLLARSRDHTGLKSGARPSRASFAHLVYGMTPRQVERLTAGSPTTIRGGCWIYHPKAGEVGGLPVRTVGVLSVGGDPGSIGSQRADALKLCFVDAALSQSFVHLPKNPATGLAAEWIPALP